jgi:hypothetical protein
MSARIASPFELQNRALKVARFVAGLEDLVAAFGYDPYGDAAEIAAALRTSTPDEWQTLAVLFNERWDAKRSHSETIAAVIAVFESRVDVAGVEDDEPFARCGSIS